MRETSDSDMNAEEIRGNDPEAVVCSPGQVQSRECRCDHGPPQGSRRVPAALPGRFHRWSDRSKAVELPLFPGLRLSAASIRGSVCPSCTVPGALYFVGIGKVPVPIDDAEVLGIQNAVRSGLATEPWEYLNVGQLVRLEEGPWRVSKASW